uniref:CRAL-TRIO domain-containing protein n=1 Tax=viral metagenome TaxID=1070528 RepID=A0A6C0ARU4_9ZZZZ
MNPTNTLITKIEKLKAEYYAESTKAMFFKKQQKVDCANMICNGVGLEEMLNHTVFVIPNTNRVYFDYTIFKTYAIPSNYDAIVKRVLDLFQECIVKYGNFEAHVNLNTFTISAFERYKAIIIKFCEECFKNNTHFSVDLVKFCIYNSPNMIDLITTTAKPFIDDTIRQKVILFNKKESEKLISDLLNF